MPTTVTLVQSKCSERPEIRSDHVIRDFAVPPGVSAGGRDGVVEVPTRDAATVMLVRDAAAGIEVFVFRRVATMAFAAGMHVFPGGRLDPGDDDPRVPWAGPSPKDLAVALGATPDGARALVVAAVRETFEECGVLLAGPDSGHLVADVTGAGWERDREALAAGETSLADVLGRRGLGVRADLLRPWAYCHPAARTAG
jgi:8-oxo-dGTP pyrophosphatase MutT (NUDIX family)